MATLINDDKYETCVCGCIRPFHIAGGGCPNHAYCEKFEAQDGTKTLNDALLVTAQAAIITEIRWLHSNNFSNYQVIKDSDEIVLHVEAQNYQAGSLIANGYTSQGVICRQDQTIPLHFKAFHITERRRGDRRRLS